MTDQIEHASQHQWSVSTQTHGEVLAVQVREPGMVLAVLGRPADTSEAEIRGWLHDLAAVAREAPLPSHNGEHLPGLLRQAVTALLFSHAEIWERGGQGSLLSVVLVDERDEVGIGWVGGGRVMVSRSDDGPEPAWVRVVDSYGREGRAWRVPDGVSILLESVWPAQARAAESSLPEAGGEAWAALIADWLSPNALVGAPGFAQSLARDDARPGAAQPFGLGSDPGSGGVAYPVGAGPDPGSGGAGHPTGVGSEPEPAGVGDPAGARAAPRAGDAGWPHTFAEGEAGYPPGGRPPAAESQEPPEPPVLKLDAEEVELRMHGLGSVESVDALKMRPAAPPGETSDFSRPSDAQEYEEFQARRLAGGGGASTPPEQAAAPEPPYRLPDWLEAQVLLARSGAESARRAPPPAHPELGAAQAQTWDRPAREAAAPGASAQLLAGSPAAGAEPTYAAEAAAATHLRGVGDTPALPRAAWPSPHELRQSRPSWLAPLLFSGLALAAVLAVVGLLSMRRTTRPSTATVASTSRVENWLSALGWAPNRFDLLVTSQPPGASISVDSIPLAQRTPARLRLASGERRVRVFFPDLGGASYRLTGKKGDGLRLDASLWGSLSIVSPEPEAMIQASVDGEPQGQLPVFINHVAPGPHQLEFSGPGLDPWERTIAVKVGQTREVLAAPMRSPATGVVNVRSVTGSDETGEPRSGDVVYIDGEPRGKTPLTVELPRGPHSVRVVQGSEAAPVQVVDLPGGNERFLTFEFGGTPPSVRLTHTPPGRISVIQPPVISAALVGTPQPKVKEMWLNVRTPEGPFRRYPMTLLTAPGSTAGAAVFPIGLLDGSGAARYYVSCSTADGEEYFTEMVRVQAERPNPARGSPAGVHR